MGILSNTVSICQFRVVGDLPEKDLFDWGSECLSKNAFQPIDDSTHELSFGWVHVDDPRETSFSTPRDFLFDHYLSFTLRRDQRKVPSVLIKSKFKEAEDDFLLANPDYKKMPAAKKHDVLDAIKSSLLGKTLPVPAMYDAVWSTETGLVTFTSLSPKIIELFENQFKETFEGLRLVMVHPFGRASDILDDNLRLALERTSSVSADNVLALIKENRWLGFDMFLWLVHRTIKDSSKYKINQAGPLENDDTFIAYIDERLILVSGEEDAVQKVTVAGPQNHFSEAHTALKKNKQITEATIFFEKGEDQWSMTLKGNMFHFASYKCPAVKLERDEITDEADEKEAVFYERMYLLEKGLQLFNSLYATFLNDRLTEKWDIEKEKIKSWLN